MNQNAASLPPPEEENGARFIIRGYQPDKELTTPPPQGGSCLVPGSPTNVLKTASPHKN